MIFFVNKYVFKFYINFIFFFNSIFILYLFYLNPKLLRMEEEIKGDESGRPQPVLPLTG